MISDFIIVVFIIGSIVVGYKTGFVKSIFKFFSGIISLLLAIQFYKPFSKFMSNTVLASNIKEKIHENILGILPNLKGTSNESVVNLILDKIYIPNPMKESIANSVPGNVIDNSQIAQLISEKLNMIVMQLVSIILIFIIIRIMLWIARIILDRLCALPILSQINKGLGFVLGFVQGMFIVYIVLGVVVILKNDFIIGAINDSLITNYLYYNNLIIDLIF